MKRLIILCFLAVCYLNCKAQQTDSNQVAIVRYPQHMKKLSRIQLADYANKRFKKGSLLFNAATRRPEYSYVVDDIVFDVNRPREYSPKQANETALDHVKQIKTNVDSWFGVNSGYSSRIEIINGSYVFIADILEDDSTRTYNFTAVNKSNNAVVQGSATFKVSDESEASGLLYELLNGVKFKH